MKPTVGLEVHAELKTKTKMFCGSLNAPHDSEPNVHVCPVCMAHPGTLPVINEQAVKHVLKVGVALEGKLATFTEFDRKNYFYPDIPKGYQISQYQYPLVSGGMLNGVAITRVHLEEDTARSLHDQGEGSVIDYNRAGVPLMELVTEPVIHDAESAAAFARELQLLLRTLGVSDANMDRGEMRVEANISVSEGGELGTKVEVKNLNSFRSVEAAIRYEVARQSDIYKKGEEVVQETRGWDEKAQKTFSQRKKETSEDYRYFPDPDLPKLDVSKMTWFSRIGDEMSELPQEKRLKYGNLGLSREAIELIISDEVTETFFCAVADQLEPEQVILAANYLLSDVQAHLTGERVLSVDRARDFAALIRLVGEKKIGSRVAKDLLPEVLFEGMEPSVAVDERGLGQQSSEDDLGPLIETILTEHTQAVEEYRSGKENALQFLIGQGMKASKGSANPEMLKELLRKKLDV